MAEKHELASLLRDFATKLASNGSSPDRMTVADGQGGITTHKEQPKFDKGESEVKRDTPSDGSMRSAASPGGSPDRMTVADGQGGITTHKGQPKGDPGECEVKRDQPSDGTTRKSASDRIARIREALAGANPNLAKAAQNRPAQGQPAQNQPAPISQNINEGTLAKIATAVLSTEEGVVYVNNLLEKQAGEQAAREQIAEAIAASDYYKESEMLKQAAFEDVFTKAAAIHKDLSERISEEEAGVILKQASDHQEVISSLEHPLLKQAYAAGMDDAAMLESAAEGQGEEGVPPVDEALPMGGQDLSEEEILGLLQEMVQQGLISPDEIEQALAGSEGGAPEAGAEM
jgi:hypothetical protein